MNWSRFSNPMREPQDAERLQAAQDERADAWHDQAIDREREQLKDAGWANVGDYCVAERYYVLDGAMHVVLRALPEARMVDPNCVFEVVSTASGVYCTCGSPPKVVEAPNPVATKPAPVASAAPIKRHWAWVSVPK